MCIDRCPDAHHNVYVNSYLNHVLIMVYTVPVLCYDAYCRSISHTFILEGFLPEALHLEVFLTSRRCCSGNSSSYKTDLVRMLKLDRDWKVS